MKKRFQLNYKITSLIFVLTLAICAGEIRAQVCTSAPNDPVSWYRAENNALDTRGGNSAILQNGAGYKTGQVGQTFDFDGVDDLAIIPDAPLYAFGTNSLTIEFWARIDSSNNYNTMITKRAEAVPFDGFNFYRAPNGILGADIKSGGTASLASDSAMQIGQIYHLALVIDRTTNTAKMYVDGVLQNSQPSLLGVGSLTNSEPFRVGRVLGSAANPNPLQAFDGLIDELSIYTRALSTSEIQAIFNAGSAGKCPAAPVPNGLVAWYMGENSPLDARGGNHAAPQNGASYADGQVGRTFNFDGSDDYYTAPSAPQINFGTGDFSVEYWIKINGAQLFAGREYGVVNKNSTYQGNPGWGFELSTEFGNFPNPRIDFFNTSSIWNSSNVRATITTNVWHHVVGLRENGVNKLYLDGVLTQTNANTNAAADVDNRQPLLVGSWLGTYFPGQLDEISLYNRALTRGEIQAIFSAGSAGKLPAAATAPVGLVEWWTADNNALGVRSRNDGILQNGVSYASGKTGQAFSFNGANYVELPNAASLNLTNQISIEAWINPTATSGSRRIIDKITPGGSDGYTLQLNGGYLNFIAGGNLFSVNPIPNNTWTHVAGVSDGTQIRVYINGVLEGSGAAATIPSNAIPLRIGADPNGGNAFSGLIDEPAIYDRALSTAEIQSIFNAGSAGKSKPTATVAPSNQTLWLSGDGNAIDLSGSGNHGTPQNGAGFAVGKVGQSFSFNGFSNYVSIPHNPAQDIRQAITIESWVMKKGDCSGFGAGGNCVVMAKQIASGNTDANLRYGLLISDTGGANQGKFLLSFNTGTWDDIVFSNTIAQNDVWYHVAGTYDGSSAKIYVNGVLEASAAKTGEILPSTGGALEIGRQSGIGEEYFNGSIDEASLYNRALSASEIASIYNAGQAGKLKETNTTGTTATVGDLSLTFLGAATRTVQQIPLDVADFPALPAGMTSTGLLYDIATDVLPTGTTDQCFNLPSFAALTSSEFNERVVLHLENGAWTNRTLSRDFTAKTICARAPSLSPFAIADSNLAPTAALLSISGRITNAKGAPIARVRVVLTGANGATRDVLTNTFGYYRFDELPAGQTYILNVSRKRYQFSPESQILTLQDAAEGVDFTAIE